MSEVTVLGHVCLKLDISIANLNLGWVLPTLLEERSLVTLSITFDNA